MTKKIDYVETSWFKKDFKKLLKRYRTLKDDFEVVKRDVIYLYHIKKVDNRSVFLIPKFCSEEMLVCKITKFACKALKGRGAKSGLRVIYAFDVESLKVEFIEMYFKGDKENEDKEKIKIFLNSG